MIDTYTSKSHLENFFGYFPPPLYVVYGQQSEGEHHKKRIEG